MDDKKQREEFEGKVNELKSEAERRSCQEGSMMRCIQISPNGPIVQGEAEIEGRRIFQTGEIDPTGRATITIGNQKHTGKLIPSKRHT